MDIVEVVQPYLPGFKRSSAGEIIAKCPFHKEGRERHPSFSMSLKPGKEGVFYCHTCHATGSLANFLKLVGVSPLVVADIVSTTDARAKTWYKEEHTGDRSFLPESILGAYHKCPMTLLDEGFSMRILDEHGVGFDESTQRITFPLRNLDGKLIGISGRSVLPNSFPKYLIYTAKDIPQVPDYVTPKKDFIWNLDKVYAKQNLGIVDRIYIAEGFKVCLWLIQHKYTDAVALAGSTATRAQRELLGNFNVEFVLALDNDDAGLSGMLDIGQYLLNFGPVKTIDPEYMDIKEAKQLSDLDSDGLQSVMGSLLKFGEYQLKLKGRIISDEPTFSR
jgi:DNA primase